ncbi:MAG: hypothetical protein N2510_07545 [Ignavibacteria bacterium]|nr:hypothetical protein [Ignavibacteria bacterium]
MKKFSDGDFKIKLSEYVEKKNTKSPFLGFLLGAAVPGLGHVYAGKFSSGKYFMISEAALWLTYAGMTIYGNWLLDDAYGFAVINAGVNLSGKSKDDIFFTNIANYNNVEDYNNDMLRRGEYDKVYLPGTGYDFYWNSEEARKLYREDKLGGDRTLNDRLFTIGAVVINHILSGVSAVFAVNSYNLDLKKRSGGLRLSAGVIRNLGKTDGIKINLSKTF